MNVLIYVKLPVRVTPQKTGRQGLEFDTGKEREGEGGGCRINIELFILAYVAYV